MIPATVSGLYFGNTGFPLAGQTEALNIGQTRFMADPAQSTGVLIFGLKRLDIHVNRTEASRLTQKRNEVNNSLSREDKNKIFREFAYPEGR